MTCPACGEKPKCNCTRDFPRAVIEINNPETLVLLRKVSIPASMGDDTTMPPVVGKYHNVILHYEANNHTYIYSSDGIPTLLEMDVPQQVWDSIDALQQEIDDLKNSPDVVDIVDTYADLMAYDTSDLGDKDIIRVLNDETHDDESTYYRWSTATQTWTYIGSTGPKSMQIQWTGNETNQDGTGDVVNVTTTTGDFKWEVGNTVTVNYTHKATRNNLKIDSVASYPIDNVRSLAGGVDSGVAIQYVCVVISNQRYYRPIGRLRASSDVAGPVFIADDLTTTGVQLTALSANQGKALKDLVDGKQNTLTFDDTPTALSDNPVKSKGIKKYVDDAKGLARILTTDDYNWNSTTQSQTEPYNCIAIWLLDSGVYTTDGEVTYLPVANTTIYGANTIILHTKSTGEPLGYGKTIVFNGQQGYFYEGVNGGVAAFTRTLVNPHIEQTTGQDTTRLMSQRAITDAIDANKGGAKILTADDYNWNSTSRDDTEPYNAIALWKLPAGLYSTGDLVLSDRVIWTRNDSLGYLTEAYTILVCNKDNQDYIPILYVLRDQSATGNHLVSGITVSTTGWLHASYNLLDTYSIVNNLTDASEKKPLSANQGRILGDRIRAMADSAPAINTKGEPGNLMPVLLNGTAHLYMCTEKNWVVDPDTQQGRWVYTWEQLV